MSDPTVERTGRSSPVGDRFYSSSPFWKKKWETDFMFSQGCGERPDYTKETSGGASGASCASYFPNISASKRGITYKGLSMKSRSVKPVRKCDLITPGPGSYKTAPLHSRSVSIQARQLDSRLFTESTSRPGPGSYTLKPDGARAAFCMTGRPVDTTKGNPKVGPGQYDSKGDFDRYCLLPVNWEPPFVKSIRVL